MATENSQNILFDSKRYIKAVAYTRLVGNYSDWVKISKQYQTLVHTCSLVSSPGAEFVKLVKRIRLGSVRKKFEHTNPYNELDLRPRIPPLPIFNNFTKKKFTNKKHAGVSPSKLAHEASRGVPYQLNRATMDMTRKGKIAFSVHISGTAIKTCL